MFRGSAKLLVVCLVAGIFFSANAPSSLQRQIDALNADTSLAHGSWGLTVLTGDSGKVLASNNPELSLIPASTLKVLTTGAALGLLGSDFRYETRIEYDGTWDSLTGVIHGNLYLTGSGDPTFDSKYYRNVGDTINLFHSLPFRLSFKGIKKIDGNIIGDASYFSDNPTPDDWTWSDMGQYYGAGTSGLCYHDNSVELFLNSVGKDTCAIESVYPQPEGVTYKSFVIADGKKDEAFVYGAPYGNIFYVYGNIPAGKKNYSVEAANPDPAYQCAFDFAHNLNVMKIETGKPTTVRRMELSGLPVNRKRKLLSVIYSDPLADVVEQTNINSDNVYAEQLLRTLGKLKGNGGTTEAGIEVVKKYWSSLGVDLRGLNMTDGSGLSRSNLITTKIQATILLKIVHQKWYGDFEHSLPVAGKTGSMTNLCKGTLAENNMHAKTGYINRARGYAGYVKTKSQKLICFALLANNYSCSAVEMKKKLEKVLVALAEIE